MCESTNQRRVGIEEDLKETGAKTARFRRTEIHLASSLLLLNLECCSD